MSFSVFAPLASLSGVRLHSGGGLALGALENALGLRLPADHRALLRESNGVDGYGGYLRLFGAGPSANLDIALWNDPKCWKFAWESRCSDYLCFGETAWGDQYAYSIPALICREPQVYFLDCLSMTPTVVASTFSEFFENEFIRSVKEPYDVMIKEVRQVLGDLEIGEHLIYATSPLLGGAEETSNVQKMDARSAMICNGDIARQLDASPADSIVKAVTAYEDSYGRMRLELTWA